MKQSHIAEDLSFAGIWNTSSKKRLPDTHGSEKVETPNISIEALSKNLCEVTGTSYIARSDIYKMTDEEFHRFLLTDKETLEKLKAVGRSTRFSVAYVRRHRADLEFLCFASKETQVEEEKCFDEIIAKLFKDPSFRP